MKNTHLHPSSVQGGRGGADRGSNVDAAQLLARQSVGEVAVVAKLVAGDGLNLAVVVAALVPAQSHQLVHVHPLPTQLLAHQCFQPEQLRVPVGGQVRPQVLSQLQQVLDVVAGVATAVHDLHADVLEGRLAQPPAVTRVRDVGAHQQRHRRLVVVLRKEGDCRADVAVFAFLQIG